MVINKSRVKQKNGVTSLAAVTVQTWACSSRWNTFSPCWRSASSLSPVSYSGLGLVELPQSSSHVFGPLGSIEINCPAFRVQNRTLIVFYLLKTHWRHNFPFFHNRTVKLNLKTWYPQDWKHADKNLVGIMGSNHCWLDLHHKKTTETPVCNHNPN